MKCIHWENKTSCTLVARAIQNISMSAQMSERIYMKDEINVRTPWHRPNTAAKALKECDDDLFPKRV